MMQRESGAGPIAAVRSRKSMFGLLLATFVCIGAIVASPALAKQAAWWRISSSTAPTNLPSEGKATIIVRAVNLGIAGVNGALAPVTMTDKLPADVTLVSAYGIAGIDHLEHEGFRGPVKCTGSTEVSCSWEGPDLLEPYEELQMYVTVTVTGAASGAQSSASISGGEPYSCHALTYPEGKFNGPFCKVTEANEEERGGYEGEASHTGIAPASVTQTLTFASPPSQATPFGVSDFAVEPEDEGGAPDTQAGSHPFQLTTSLAFNEAETPSQPPAFAKDVQINLPPGLIGNAQGIPECADTQFTQTTQEGSNSNLCPDASAIGVASVNLFARVNNQEGPIAFAVPVFNLVPAAGEPARFGFEVEKAPVVIDTSVRTGTDYGVVAHISNLSQLTIIRSSVVTLWGVPGDGAHGLARGWNCVDGGYFFEQTEPLLPVCGDTGEAEPRPFLRLPTSCTGPLSASVAVDSWEDPTTPIGYEPSSFGHQDVSLDGCSALPFSPEFLATPDMHSASTPTGLSVAIGQGQEANENPTGLGTSDIKDTTVTLPEGFTLNASSANGLEGCTDAQIGYEPEASSATNKVFTSAIPSCPPGSKLGTVEIKVPLLAHPLEGAMYLASPQNLAQLGEPTQNPFQSLVAMYIVARDPSSGVLVKLPGKVTLSEVGRVTATFESTPQDPIEALDVNFFGGSQSALSTPSRCGTYVTEATFTPWSGAASKTEYASSAITSGRGGAPCPGTLPFAPTLLAGTPNNRGGAFSPLVTSVAREDGSQDIEALTLHLPPGLTALLSSVTLCEEAQANAGTCGAESLIGHTTVSVGVGSDPYTVTGGQVFITGPYKGAPFGLSIVTPAIAGPFNLGTVIVRATLEIDPHTADVTVVTGAIPHILKGIPVHIQHLNVAIDRPGFVVNPTNCDPLAFTGSVVGLEGASAAVTEPFEAADCAGLAFKPKFSASTSGKTSKANGASLNVKLVAPHEGPQSIGAATTVLGTGSGSGASSTGASAQTEEANIKSVKVELPKALPSQLKTLQKACTAKQFDANPAGCPKESVVGMATAVTPVLPVPLTGPAYFVSHGNEAFPQLIVVLQGYGVTVDLVGDTFISKAGITSSTFGAVPDVPVSTFELNLPQGKFSALAANGNLCTQKLVMPTDFTAQNGLKINESTKVGVTGCAKAHKAKKKHKKQVRKGKRK
jgi:hypothetical protein